MFLTTASMVALLLLYALAGFLLAKSKLVRSEAIPAFAKVLLYVCQPALTLYSFSKAEFSKELLINMGIFFLITFLGQLLILAVAYPFLRKKSRENISYRILHISLVLSNCGFFGVPVSEVLFPEMKEAALYCMTFSLGFNIICWTAVMTIVTRDLKYIKPRQVFLNPSTLSFAFAFLLLIFGVKLPDLLSDSVSVIGRFATPLCMLILGMRLGYTELRKVFVGVLQYVAVAVNQIAVPLLIFLALLIIPIDPAMKKLAYVLFACPVASNVLNFAELCGEGQENAASNVLLGTIFSVLTMPLMVLLIN
ncbi:MAG: AEC family transporter [Eubacteriales bacterium]|nr:AEC family transporter [Eubacteriales bacterium]